MADHSLLADAAAEPRRPGPASEGEGSAMDLPRLVAEHHAELYRYAYRLSGSAADAEDLTQQVFLTAHAKLHQVRDDGSVRGWLFTVLRNAWLKSRRRRTPVPAASLELDIEDIPAEVPREEIDRERLQNAIDGLADDFKIVLLLFYFEGCSYREMAERLDVPPGTIMSRLSRAKGQLRARLFREQDED